MCWPFLLSSNRPPWRGGKPGKYPAYRDRLEHIGSGDVCSATHYGELLRYSSSTRPQQPRLVSWWGSGGPSQTSGWGDAVNLAQKAARSRMHLARSLARMKASSVVHLKSIRQMSPFVSLLSPCAAWPPRATTSWPPQAPSLWTESPAPGSLVLRVSSPLCSTASVISGSQLPPHCRHRLKPRRWRRTTPRTRS